MSWNKGQTKKTHPGVMKISNTMRLRKIDNFRAWRNQMKALGKIPNGYLPIEHCEELAEYIGVILGDGNISKFPRTERLILTGNSNNQGFIKRYAEITQTLFHKKPCVSKLNSSNATRIAFYQKEISNRLGIPCGSRKNLDYTVPKWILKKDGYLVAFLKGLFEAEGSLSIHLPTCTYNFQFRNNNKSLLSAVKDGLIHLGYHPEVRTNSTRLRKRGEVEKFRNLIKFRNY